MKASKWLCLLGGALISVTPLSAQMKIVQNGKPAARIIADPAIPTDMRAAELLQDFVQRISGARLEITDTDQPRKGDILIGEGNQQGLTEDGFRLKTDNGRLYISSGGDKGSIYGVVTLLERYLGVSYYGANAYTLTESKDVHLPAIDLAENPAFRYRQSQCYAMAEDPVYKDWFRFEEPRETFAGGYWVHTFERILPSDVYGKSHPEFYSFINGKRRPGKASQWCLTNPELFEVVCTKIDSIFKANPGMKMISVSQNDGNFTNCSCPACKELDQREGGPSGSLIHFLNRLAERFPDKEFSTLAYLFTMHPPREVKPLPNVNIMLCDIDCMREVPLTDNASGRDFVRALEGWSAISNSLFIWDYGINFDNMVAPFPNFPILQKNIQLFKKHHATMHFSQIGGSKGSCFPEMRAYMVSKLMWNPYQNSDSLMRSFMNGYYGAAAPYIYQYEKLLEGGLLASQKGLWIYDSPVTHKDGMLNFNCRKRYNELFDQAEEAVRDDSTLLERVRLSRLPLQYAELEIIRAEGVKDAAATAAKLDLFEQRCAHFNVRTLNERSNPPSEYCQLYRERYMPSTKVNLAKGAKIIWINAPAPRYRQLGETALTDGLFGGTTFVESWVGWEGVDGSFIVDLGQEMEFTTVESDFLHQLGAWILLPEKVTYSTSSDNQHYEFFGEQEIAEDRTPKVKFVQITAHKDQPVKARYIRVDIVGTKTCPSWHYGIGHPSWFFVDEVSVMK